MSAGARSRLSLRHILSQQDHSRPSMGMPAVEPEFISVFIHVRYFLQKNDQHDHEIIMVDDYERITTLRLRLFDSALSLVLPLSQRLSSLGVPVDYWHDPLLPEISNFGKLMAVDSRNSNFMILQMGVEIEMLTFQQRNEDLDAAMARAVTRTEDPLSAEPAYRSDLENFRVQKEDLCLIPECVICLDKPSVFQKVSRLPCSHVFHWDCIVKWLINKKKCPMCHLRVRL